MNMKISRIMIFLLSILLLVLLITGCDRFSRNDSKTKKKQNASEQPVQTPTPTPKEVETEKEDIENADAERRASLPSGEYGRDDPFESIVVSRSSRKRNVNTRKAKPTPAPRPARVVSESTTADKEIYISLSAVLGNIAILMVDGSSKSVSVGDTFSGLKVSNIKEGEVTLERGNENFTVTLGVQTRVKAK